MNTGPALDLRSSHHWAEDPSRLYGLMLEMCEYAESLGCHSVSSSAIPTGASTNSVSRKAARSSWSGTESTAEPMRIGTSATAQTLPERLCVQGDRRD